MGAPKGRPKPKGSGRKKGTPNVMTTAIKDAIMTAFNAEGGGAEYLTKLRDSHPQVYCRLLEKVLPAELKIDPGSELQVLIRDYTGLDKSE